ncbi:MAG: hypothetical protein JJ908_15220 [Rhizobiales bacterium]|nr:hypothetical protein [Hyphomicrobiales bacterium]MBO6700116.1 hypothetical protein [Hyphomicrobiales bacterium]MBO6737719.1 hypothetical protein [Hyphomicrobiales bacterium]MBO6913224.1 hypothetical protein [Hyphomicrobiales bacterium]MBO6954268.1 hypothetical protein [Hyphomicrobiales bacterium]
MIVLGFAVVLYLVAAVMVIMAARRDRASVGVGFREAWDQLLAVLPALTVGILGAGFVAALMPPELAETYLGEGSGAAGYAIAYVIGALTPGGPVVGFALGAAAIKAGASVPIVVVYVTAWALVSLNRLLIWELATVPKKVIVERLIVSAPIPILTGLVMELLV